MGPLSGLRIVEIAGIGPGQLCGMLLADLGAQVLRVERAGGRDRGLSMPDAANLMNRSRPCLAIDVKHPAGRELVLRLCARSDALFEGFRPGVMERLGLGPEACLERNPRLVYGRMTGWGQSGPLAREAGHDTNYLALSGALAAIGEPGRAPVLPLNLVADFGGGALYLAFGLLAALLEAQRSGQGQVVDAAMVDGIASMTTAFYGLLSAGLWQEQRGANLLDGGAPFMRTYRTADGGYVAVAALENRFYRNLLDGLGMEDVDPARQMARRDWPDVAARLSAVFEARSRDEWAAHFAGRDACVTPVLSFTEATSHPHHRSRGTYSEFGGVVQPAPAPRFSRTPGQVRCPPGQGGSDPVATLAPWEVPAAEVESLLRDGVITVN